MSYLVNRETKEHRFLKISDVVGSSLPKGRWDVVECDPDGWIEWHGGECPLPDGAPYETKHESGGYFEGNRPETFGVHWRGYRCDAVVAYRPILDAKAEPPAWDGEGLPPVGVKVDHVGWESKRLKEVLIVAHHDGLAIGCFGPDVDDYQAFMPDELRPIRSEEDRAVEEMADVMREVDGAVLTGRTQESIARALHRAGYRKTGDT